VSSRTSDDNVEKGLEHRHDRNHQLRGSKFHTFNYSSIKLCTWDEVLKGFALTVIRGVNEFGFK
jgi:hypothetical protein